MKRTWIVALVLTLLPLVFSSCAGTSEAEKENRVSKPPVAVETETVAPADLVEGIDITGSLDPKFCAEVKTQVPGLVREVYVTEWVRVRKGQPLLRIDQAENEALVKRAEAAVESARANLAQTQVAATRVEREHARTLKLKEAGLATQQSVDDARSESAAAVARIEAARAQIRVANEELRQARVRLGKGVVVAPIEGVVAERGVNVGDLAGDGAGAKPVFRIVDNRLLNLTVTVSSADSARVRVGQGLEFTVDSLPGRTFSGRVMFINPELTAADRSLKVIAEVRNVPEVLKGGLFAKGRIITGSRNAVLQIPRLALLTWDTAKKTGTVFVVEGNVARQLAVRTGIVAGESVEIVGGLKSGQALVTRGAFNLREGDRVAASPAKNGTQKAAGSGGA